MRSPATIFQCDCCPTRRDTPPHENPLNLLVNSTGIEFHYDGE